MKKNNSFKNERHEMKLKHKYLVHTKIKYDFKKA